MFPQQIKDGWQMHAFALHFPLFSTLRKHLDFTITSSAAFSAAERKPKAQFVLAIFPHGVA